MFKQLLIASAIFCAVFARTRVTPRTRLPQSFDDMLFNHKFSTGLGNTNSNAAFFKIDGNARSILGLVAESMPWMDVTAYSAIIKSLDTLETGDIQSHYVFKAFPEEAVFRYAIINLVRKDATTFTGVYAQKESKAFGIQSTNTYHSVRTSVLGLNFQEPIVLHQTGHNSAEFHNFNREQLMAILKSVRATKNVNGLGFNIAGALQGATSAVSGFVNLYKDIATAFRTVKKEEFKQKIGGEGFDKYASKTRFLRTLGVPIDSWDRYVTAMKSLMELNKHPDIDSNVTAIMQLLQFVPDAAWQANDFTFDKDKGGVCNTVVALGNQDIVERRANVLFTYVTGSFTLAPDIFIYTKFLSAAGGIYESTKDRIEHRARSINEDTIKAVHATMLLSALNVMAENLGVTIKLPPLKTIIDQA